MRYKTTKLVEWLCEEQNREWRILLVPTKVDINRIKQMEEFSNYNGVCKCIVDVFSNKDKYKNKSLHIGATSAKAIIRVDDIDTCVKNLLNINSILDGIDKASCRDDIIIFDLSKHLVLL